MTINAEPGKGRDGVLGIARRELAETDEPTQAADDLDVEKMRCGQPLGSQRGPGTAALRRALDEGIDDHAGVRDLHVLPGCFAR
jgi:hypothetical protein